MPDHDRNQDDDFEQACAAATKNEILKVYPDVDFTTFILSLETSCLVNMGCKPEVQREADFALAHHEIELLSMLEEKTRGNLSGDEERLLLQVLADLKAKFTEVVKTAKSV